MAEEHLRVLDAVGRYVLITALIHRLFESLSRLIRSQRREDQFQRGIVKLHNTFAPREVKSRSLQSQLEETRRTRWSQQSGQSKSLQRQRLSARDRHR